MGKLRKLASGGVFLFWQFAALNFSLLLVLAMVGWKMGYLSGDKLSRMKALVLEKKEPEPEKEPLTSAEYEKLKTEEERARWLRKALQAVLQQRKEQALLNAQLQATLDREKGVLDDGRQRLESQKKALADQAKQFEANKNRWQIDVTKKGFQDVVDRLVAMDNAGAVATILLNQPPERIAQFLYTFKRGYAGEVLLALKQQLEAKGKLPLIEKVLEALENRTPPPSGEKIK